MTGPTAHHELGASGAYRWLVCLGSVAAQRGLAESSSVYAEEGTSAHELGEATLNFWKGVKGATRATQEWNKAAVAAGYDVREMVREVDKYVEYVKDLCKGDPDALAVELRVSFGDLIPGGFGTSDTVVVLRDDDGEVDRIDIGDLKYGRGKQVEAANNPQLRLYAFGTVLSLIADGVLDEDLDDFDAITIGLHICQPRLNHFDADEMTVSELFKWAQDDVAPVVQDITDGDETRRAGSHCDFCKVQATCREKAEQQARDLDTDFDDFVEDGPKTPNADELTADEIGKLLAHRKDVEKWFKALEAHAYAEIEKGGDVPGWKLVAGRRSRKWEDDAVVFDAFRNQRALKQDEYAPRKLLTPPQAEKLLAKGSKILDMIIATDGKPTLVKASDKKPALTFGNIVDEFDNDDEAEI